MLAQELLKQPYNFDFLGLHDDAHEREIEHTATEHITKFLLELGKGKRLNNYVIDFIAALLTCY
jgi:predicted nuclease of restriction endonuclease-like (RecB) superfamily